MILKLNGPIRIENLRHYPEEMIDRLRGVLVSGAYASADPRRKNLYDVEAGDRIFYIHISPTGKVLLLATWAREGAPLATLQEAPAEAVACSG